MLTKSHNTPDPGRVRVGLGGGGGGGVGGILGVAIVRTPLRTRSGRVPIFLRYVWGRKFLNRVFRVRVERSISSCGRTIQRKTPPTVSLFSLAV